MLFESEINSTSLLPIYYIKKSILSKYNMEDSEVTEIKFKNTNKQRAVYKVDFKDKSYCLKKVYFNKRELLFLYSAMEWCSRNKINVPKILPTKEGGRFVEYKNMLFILSPWVDGEKLSYDNLEHILISSHTLSKIHKTGRRFIPVKGSIPKIGFESMQDLVEKRFNSMLNSSNSAFYYKDKFSKIYLDNFEICLETSQISKYAVTEININNLSRSLCHMDYVNKNIIFDSYNNQWTIDFDRCCIDYSMHDYAYYLRRLLKRDKTKWDMKILLHSLNEYEKTCEINKDDYLYLLAYLSFPQKYFKIARDYYKNIKKCNKAAFISLLQKSTEKIDYQLKFALEFKDYINDKFGN